MACLLREKGLTVTIFEKRPDPRSIHVRPLPLLLLLIFIRNFSSKSPLFCQDTGKSINLALSVCGVLLPIPTPSPLLKFPFSEIVYHFNCS